MYDQGFSRWRRWTGPWPLIRRWRSGDPSFGRPFYQRPNANEIALLGHPLISLHYAHASIISLKLKLKQIWGNDDLYLVQGRPPQDDVIGRGHVNL